MTRVAAICEFFEHFAPPRLAAEWDNVGLLVGRAEQSVHTVLTCLTITAPVIAEARAEQVDLIVTHHPLPFRALKQITTATPAGRMLLELIESRIAVYSPHTSFDSAARGINQGLAEMLGLADIRPLQPLPGADDSVLGAGRWGSLAPPATAEQLATQLKLDLGPTRMQLVGDPRRLIHRLAVACGSAGEFLESAGQYGCDMFVTGETSFHTCLAAEAAGIVLLLLGHYASERFGLERLAEILAGSFPDLRVWASRRERDPIRWI